MFKRRAATTTQTVTTQRAHRPDYQLLLYAGLLMLLGLIIMYSIGPQRAQLLNSAVGKDIYSDTYFVSKQLVSLAIALTIMITLIFLPLRLLKQYAGVVLLSGLVLCGLLFVFGSLHVSSIAQCTNGACRWINLGPLGSFQPAELLKFGILIFLARFIAERIRAGTLNDWKESLQPLLIIAGFALFVVIVVQKDMGTGIALASIIASMLFMAGLNWKIGLKILLAALLLGVVLIFTASHRIERVLTFIQGDKGSSSQNALDADYQIRHAKIAIGTGGLTGVGIGNSIEATGYLPEAINDSLFAILGETFGFVGLTVIIIILAALLMRTLRVADRVLDPWMRLVAAGVFGWLAAHTILNIASMVGIFPLTGITLPLLSFGGTSMLFIAAAIGLVFHISRYTSHETIVKENAYADSSRGRGIGWTRDTGRRRTE